MFTLWTVYTEAFGQISLYIHTYIGILLLDKIYIYIRGSLLKFYKNNNFFSLKLKNMIKPIKNSILYIYMF